MAVRGIVFADDPILRKKSKKVKHFGEDLQALINDMVETMHAANGAGLAAPQIGVLERVIVVQLPEDEEDPQGGQLFALCNPQIVRANGEEKGDEGCLCLPGYVGEVKRATSVIVKAQDRRGKKVRIKAEGFLARVFQHEADHLDGILYIDRVESPDKIRRIVPPAEEESEDTQTEVPL
ncbi:MAG: peptide deformylase [Chloroflexi bacterium]|nr:peptide deformylase [Chloroflexota bacterium]